MNRKDLFLAAALAGYIVKMAPATREEAQLAVERAKVIAALFESAIDTEDEHRGKKETAKTRPDSV